jgi:transportin-1
MQLLNPILPNIIPLLVQKLDPDHLSITNNASWSIGEIAMHSAESMQPFVASIMVRLIQMMTTASCSDLHENVAITIGRLGLACTAAVAPTLPEFGRPWLSALAVISERDEKEHAFRGLCFLIRANPEALGAAIVPLCDAIASWTLNEEDHGPAPHDLNQMFGEILHSYKSYVGDRWPQFFSNCESEVQSILVSVFQL